ncbi:hypothetical protein BDW69DRAFT_181780 [Aspergillus filifer]
MLFAITTATAIAIPLTLGLLSKTQRHLFTRWFPLPSKPLDPCPKDSGPLNICFSEPQVDRGPQYRFHFGAQAISVSGYPSTGGELLLDDVSPVEVEYLGYDRLEVPMRYIEEDQAVEDLFCEKLRGLGARFWARPLDLFYHEMSAGSKDADPFIRVGYPDGGGAWVLHTTVGDAGSKGAVIIKNASTMEERCMLIQRIGGVFYENPRNCPALTGDQKGESQITS